MATIRLVSSNGAAMPLPRTTHALSPLARKAMQLEQVNDSAANLIEKLIDDALKRAAGVRPIEQLAPAAKPQTRNPEHEKFSIDLYRRCSGPKRTFYISTLKEFARLGSHDFHFRPIEQWTDDLFDYLIQKLRTRLPVPGKVSVQVKRVPAYNYRHHRFDPATGPRLCHHLSLCVLSGKWRIELSIGRDFELAGTWAGQKLATLPDTEDSRLVCAVATTVTPAATAAP